MTRKTRTSRKPAAKPQGAARALSTAKASAIQAIDAGRHAAATVRHSAMGAFDTLVKQGAALESSTRKAAVSRFRKTRKEALAVANVARNAAIARAEGAKAKTVEAVSQLEKVFEKRVSQVISRLGVPTTKDVRALSRQVSALQASVDQLRRSRSRARA